jgi:hypothetical protein
MDKDYLDDKSLDDMTEEEFEEWVEKALQAQREYEQAKNNLFRSWFNKPYK